MEKMRFDVVQPRALPNGKVAWHNIGVAFADEGKGITVILRSMPLPQLNRERSDIEVRFMLFKPRDKSGDMEDGSHGGGKTAEAGCGGAKHEHAEPGAGAAGDDNVPF